jgi:hypothetical protein
MIIGIIGFVIIPALLWTPVTTTEMVETLRQAHLVKRYEIQTQADIGMLRATLMRAHQLSAKGVANLTEAEVAELTGVVAGLMAGMDRTIEEIRDTVGVVSGVTLPYERLSDDESVQSRIDMLHTHLLAPPAPTVVRFQLPNSARSFEADVVEWTNEGAYIRTRSGERMIKNEWINQ